MSQWAAWVNALRAVAAWYVPHLLRAPPTAPPRGKEDRAASATPATEAFVVDLEEEEEEQTRQHQRQRQRWRQETADGHAVVAGRGGQGVAIPMLQLQQQAPVRTPPKPRHQQQGGGPLAAGPIARVFRMDAPPPSAAAGPDMGASGHHRPVSWPTPAGSARRWASARTGAPPVSRDQVEAWRQQLFHHIRFNRVEEVVGTLGAGCPVEVEDQGTGDTPLLAACRFGWLEIADVCLQRGGCNDPHPAFGRTALQVRAQ